jgi:predicted amidohydrolase YtcJ
VRSTGSSQLLLKKANLFPLGEIPPGADALLIQDGRIASLGRTRELIEVLDSSARVIDLKGQTVLPGFIDTHVHLAETGLLRQGLDLSPAENIGQALEMLVDAFPNRSHAGFFRAHSFDPSLMPEDRYLTRKELDAISSQVPIFVLRRDGHSCVVNTAFLRHCELSPDASGVEVDVHTGKPTGTLRALALERARVCRHRLLGEENRSEAIWEACRQAVRRGVTTLHAICGRIEDVDLLGRLVGELPLEVVPYPNTMDLGTVVGRGWSRIGGDILVDGSLGSHTAALSRPYADRPEEHGHLYHAREHLVDFIGRAHSAGLQVAMHAIGDQAIEELLAAFEEVLGNHPREDHRHRIEHAELLRPGQIERIARWGIVLAVQPAFEAFWGGPEGMYASRLGPERVCQTNPFRQLQDAGIVIAGGSDSPITPIDPLAGMAAAVGHPNPRHRLSLVEAVRLFTSGGATAAFQEEQKGLLREGLRADLVVLSRDPRRVSAEGLGRIPIGMVICGGRIVLPEAVEQRSATSPKKK